MNFTEAIERLECPQRPARCDLSSENNSSKISWDLNTGFGHAHILAKDGWAKKSDEIQRYFSEVQRLVANKVTTSLDVAGEAVDIGAYLDGEPECMLTYNAPEVQSFKIVVNISARASADAKLLLNRGIAVASLVYALQSNAIGVSLHVGEWTSTQNRQGDVHETLIEINSFLEYIDPGRPAFWLAHPAALRRCIFRYQEQQDDNIRYKFGFKDGGGYGYPTDPKLEAYNQERTIYIPFPETEALEHYRTPDKAFEAVWAIAAQQGIILREGRG